MPEAKAKKRGGGYKPYRTFYTAISFRVSLELHDQMKLAATEIHVRLEDVYREAALLLLDRRQRKPVTYQAAPRSDGGRRVTIKMAADQQALVREATDADHRYISDFFETAAILYLGRSGRP